MLTPTFKVTQDTKHLLLRVDTPYAKLNDVEVYCQNEVLRFYCQPYFLRLHFSGFLEDEPNAIKYDTVDNCFIISVIKSCPGEHFENLDMLAYLLKPQRVQKIGLITELNAESNTLNEKLDDDLLWDQTLSPPSKVFDFKYGFGFSKAGVLNKRQDEVSTMFDLPNPDDLGYEERFNRKSYNEIVKFSFDHYLADLHDDEVIQTLLAYDPSKQLQSDFTKGELEVLNHIGTKSFIFDKWQTQQCYFTLLDVLLAYAYEQRTTEGNSTVESNWTVCKLAASLSCFVHFSDVKSVCTSFVRRCLVFPLFRHFQLAVQCLHDAVQLINCGLVTIISNLLIIRSFFVENTGEPWFLINQLFIDDLIIWTQTSLSYKNLLSLSESISHYAMTCNKCDVDLALDEVETIGMEMCSDAEKKSAAMPSRLRTIQFCEDDSDDE